MVNEGELGKPVRRGAEIARRKRSRLVVEGDDDRSRHYLYLNLKTLCPQHIRSDERVAVHVTPACDDRLRRKKRTRARGSGERFGVARDDVRPLARIDVHLGEIAAHVREREQSRVHHLEPERRHVGEREHAEVAAGQLR